MWDEIKEKLNEKFILSLEELCYLLQGDIFVGKYMLKFKELVFRSVFQMDWFYYYMF